MSSPRQAARVRFSSLDDAQRVVFCVLEGAGLSAVKCARLSNLIAAALRDAGSLGSSVEQHYSAGQVAALMAGRTSAWAVKHARDGDFGPVACDGGHWLIPASGLRSYLSAHFVTSGKVAAKKLRSMGEIGVEKDCKRDGNGRPGCDRGLGRADSVSDGHGAQVVSMQGVIVS